MNPYYKLVLGRRKMVSCFKSELVWDLATAWKIFSNSLFSAMKKEEIND